MGQSRLSEDGSQRHPLPLTPATVPLNALMPAHGGLTGELTEQASKAKRNKVTQAREVRSVQRRLLAEFQDIETGDLLKFNHLEVSYVLLIKYTSRMLSWQSMLYSYTVSAERANIRKVSYSPVGFVRSGAYISRRNGDRVCWSRNPSVCFGASRKAIYATGYWILLSLQNR